MQIRKNKKNVTRNDLLFISWCLVDSIRHYGGQSGISMKMRIALDFFDDYSPSYKSKRPSTGLIAKKWEEMNKGINEKN